MKQEWYKSWALWLSIGALVVWVVKEIWHIDLGAKWNELSELLLAVLVGFGVINNPNVSNRWVLTEGGKDELDG